MKARELGAVIATSLPGAAVPWILQHWPGGHDPNHLAVVHVLRAMASPDSTYHQYFDEQLRFAPYSLHYWILLGLSRFVSLVAADKIIVSGLALGIPLSLLLLFARVAPKHSSNAILFGPFALTYPIVSGMHAFVIAIVAALVGWALYEAPPTSVPPLRRRLELGGAALAFTLSALAHPFGVALGVLAVGVREWRELLHVRKTWPRLLVVFGPAVLFVAAFSLFGSQEAAEPSRVIVNPASLVSITYALGRIVTGLHAYEVYVRLPIVALVAWGLVRVIRRDRAAYAPLLRVALVLALLHFAAPHAAGEAQIPFRLTYLLFFVCFACADIPLVTSVGRKLALAGAVAVALLPLQIWSGKAQGNKIAATLALADHVPRGARVTSIQFPGVGVNDSRVYFAQRTASLVLPTMPWGYLVLERDVVTPLFLAANGSMHMSGSKYRPLRYKEPLNPNFMPLFTYWTPGSAVRGELCFDFLELEERSEPCETWQLLRYRSFVWAALAYDRVLVIDAPAAFLQIIDKEMDLEVRSGTTSLYKPRLGVERPSYEEFVAGTRAK